MSDTSSRSAIPADPKTQLRRQQASAALKEAGYPVETSSLEAMVVRGGGPPFRKFGRIPLYTWGETLAWAEGRLTAPRRTSAEAAAQQAA